MMLQLDLQRGQQSYCTESYDSYKSVENSDKLYRSSGWQISKHFHVNSAFLLLDEWNKDDGSLDVVVEVTTNGERYIGEANGR